MPGIIGSVLGLVGLVSVYCDWVRWKVWSADFISVWQHVKLSEQVRPWDTLACCWGVKQPTNKTNRNFYRNKYLFSEIYVEHFCCCPFALFSWYMESSTAILCGRRFKTVVSKHDLKRPVNFETSPVSSLRPLLGQKSVSVGTQVKRVYGEELLLSQQTRYSRTFKSVRNSDVNSDLMSARNRGVNSLSLSLSLTHTHTHTQRTQAVLQWSINTSLGSRSGTPRFASSYACVE